MRITVLKLNERGEETWRYSGEVIERTEDRLVLEAYFDREDSDLYGMSLARGDRFIETYFANRWYNIFEIRARQDDRLRGWYCNIGMPATWNGDTLSYVDLALDLLVFPDGRQLVVDEDEFDELEISPETRLRARRALQELRASFPPPGIGS